MDNNQISNENVQPVIQSVEQQTINNEINNNDIKQINVEPVINRKSADMVRECMVIAGEACAAWALNNRLPFPFICQEEGELPARKDWLSGLAGAWQLRRAMRPRSISPKPGVHWGLGLDLYSQVTSPLRRYADLLCHQQIRAFIKQLPVLKEDELSLRLGVAEAAAATAVKAERASRLHWLAVYLSDKKNTLWEGIILDIKGNRAVVFVTGLGIETQINIKGKYKPNDKIDLVLLTAKIPELELVFAQT
jgi:exoribonuclease-2